MAGKKRRGFITYRSYSFRDKDPLIDLIRDARSNTRMSYTEVHEKSDVTVATLKRWENGDVRKPFACTALAVILGMGYGGIGMRNGKPYLLPRSHNRG